MPSARDLELVAGLYELDIDYSSFHDPEAVAALMSESGDFYHSDFAFRAVVAGTDIEQRGVEGYLTVMRDWLAPWESYAITAERIAEADGGRIAALTRHVGRMKDGGAEVRTQGVDLWTVRDGLFVALDSYLDRAQGLMAAGLAD